MDALIRKTEKKECEKRQTNYWLFVCLYFSLFFLRDIFGINISYYLISLVTMGIILILPIRQIPAFVLSSFVFSSSGFSGVFAMCVFFPTILRFSKYINKIKTPLFILILICLLEIFHAVTGVNVAYGSYLTFLLSLITMGMITQLESSEIDIPLMQKSFYVFSLFFVVLVFLQMLISFGSLEDVINIGMRGTEYKDLKNQGEALLANANYLTVLCSTGLAMSAMFLTQVKKKLFYIFALIIFVFIGLLTVSKMFAGILVLFSLYFFYIAAKKNILYLFGALALIAASAFFLYYLFSDTLIDALILRFSKGDITTGRVDIVGDMLSYMNKKPWLYLLGVGILELSYVMFVVVGSNAVHSSVFEVLGGWGIPGLIFVVSFIVSLISKVRRENPLPLKSKFNALPLIIVIIYSFAGMLFSSQSGVARLIVCIYALAYVEKREDDKK